MPPVRRESDWFSDVNIAVVLILHNEENNNNNNNNNNTHLLSTVNIGRGSN